MTRGLSIAAASIVLASAGTAATAAPSSSIFAQAAPGSWELSGVPGASAPPRQCVSDIGALAQFEHRGRACTRRVVTDRPGSALIEYSCGQEGFGRSQMTLITPRSLRIETQGISGGLPFNYVLQARRVGECAAPKAALRH